MGLGLFRGRLGRAPAPVRELEDFSVMTVNEQEVSASDGEAAVWIIDGTMPPGSGEGNDGDYATKENDTGALDIYEKAAGSWSVVGQKDATTGAVPANLGHAIDGYDQLFEKTFWGVSGGEIRLWKDAWTNGSKIQGLSPADVTHSNRAEVLAKVQAGNDWNTGFSVGVFLAGAGETHDAAQGYFALLDHDNDAIADDTQIRIVRKASGAAASTLTGPTAVDSQDHDNFRWIRFRIDPDINGLRLRAKAWINDEPSSWQVDVVDTSPLPLPGRLGLTSWRRNRNTDRWSGFYYGTGSYGAYAPAVATDWALVGNLKSLTDNLGVWSITGLTGDTIVMANSASGGEDDLLRAWQFDGADWSLIASLVFGSGLGTANALATLSSTRVALVDNIEPRELRAYDLSDATFSQVGNALAISGLGSEVDITAMSATRIALIDAQNQELRVYDFDGTDWSQTGNGLTINNSGAAVAAVNSTDVAVYEQDVAGTLQMYRFDGADFSPIGNAGETTGSDGTSPARNGMTHLFGNYVALADEDLGELQTWWFDGTDWAQVGNGLSIVSVDVPALATMSPSEVAFIYNFDEELGFYRFS